MVATSPYKNLSAILVVIVAVIPGLFAQRTRNQLVPRSFATQGVTAELAELVALGVATRGILAFFGATIFLLVGWLHQGDPDVGMLSAAVVGKVFTSPSSDSVFAAIKAVSGEPGIPAAELRSGSGNGAC
jgi:hypothetical protein